MAAASCLPVDCCWPVIGRMKPILTLLSCAPAPPAATKTAAQAAASKRFCCMELLPFIALFSLRGIPTFRPGLVQFLNGNERHENDRQRIELRQLGVSPRLGPALCGPH